jgi:hypothetical protein
MASVITFLAYSLVIPMSIVLGANQVANWSEAAPVWIGIKENGGFSCYDVSGRLICISGLNRIGGLK